MADPAPQVPSPPPTRPVVLPPPPSSILGGGATRRSRWRSPWLLIPLGIVGVLVIVGFLTGNVSLFLTVGPGPQQRVIPADNVPQVGTPDDHGHIEGSQVSFDYPTHWHILRQPDMAVTGSPTGLTMVGIAPENQVAVETMRLTGTVSRDNFKEFTDQMAGVVRDQVGASGWGVQNGPTPTTLGGLPAVGYVLLGPGPDGANITERVVFTASGSTEYWISCDSTKAHKTAIAKGCDQILRTLQIHEGS